MKPGVRLSILSLVIGALLLGGCATTLRTVKLQDGENALLAKNWAIAKELVQYDYFSWIGSDSLLKYQSSVNLKNVSGWIVDKRDSVTNVAFGKIKDSCFVSNFRISFVKDHPFSPALGDSCYASNSDAYIGLNAMIVYKGMLKKEFDSLNVPMNSYVLFHRDTIIVYFFPGSSDKYSIVGGGYKGKFLKNSLEIIENVKLHKAPIFMPDAPENAVESFRISSMGDIINEVDIAQALILKTRLKTQIIATEKYLFKFTYNKNTGQLDFKVLPKN